MSNAAVRTKKRDIAVSFSTRLSLSTRDLLDVVAEREGLSLREIVEQAIEAKWGSGVDSAPVRLTVVENDAETNR